MKPLILLTSALALAACVTTAPEEAPRTGPEGLLAGIYDGSSVNIDAFADPSQRSEYFTANMISQIEAAETCAIARTAASLDFNPLLPSPDNRRGDYVMNTRAQTATAAQVDVMVQRRGVVQDVLTFTILSRGSNWRIDEIAHGGIALSRRLTSVCAEPEIVEDPLDETLVDQTPVDEGASDVDTSEAEAADAG